MPSSASRPKSRNSYETGGGNEVEARAARPRQHDTAGERQIGFAEIILLLNTLRELAAIRSTAEDAAGRILESAENLLAFADKDEAKKAETVILEIMTACGFHDLVGQRVTKITETLDRVIATRLNDAEAGQKTSVKRTSEIALEGPVIRARARRGSTRCSETTRP
jgi:hypothetical protein